MTTFEREQIERRSEVEQNRLSQLPEDCWRVELSLLDPTNPERGRLAVITPPANP